MRMFEQQQGVADFGVVARRDHGALQRERRLILDEAEIRDAQCTPALHHLRVDASCISINAACVIASNIVGCPDTFASPRWSAQSLPSTTSEIKIGRVIANDPASHDFAVLQN